MIKVYFEDQEILVIEKPPGLVVTKTETQSEDTLEDILIRDFKINLDRGGIVHRLDKDTSGLMVIAKTENSLLNLQSQFKEREVKKKYLTLVHGMVEKEGRVEGGIERNPENREKFMVSDSGKEAVTDYRPIKRLEIGDQRLVELFPDFNKIQMRRLVNMHYSSFTLLECFPLTGRTHQIRVHLKHIGFPIVGDDKYGGRKIVRLDHRFCQRQFLHAAELSFNHPQTKERLEFKSDLPEDLKNAWKVLTLSSYNLP